MRSFIGAHRLVVVLAGVVAAALVAFVLLYFEPQALLIDHRVDEPLPAAAGSPESAQTTSRETKPKAPALRVLASGTFSSYEHSTSGRARVLRLRDGSRYLRLDHFATSNGPDVRVYLSAAPAGGPGDAFDDEYVELGELRGNIGDQNYTIPPGVDLSSYESAVIWCKRFSVAFGAAPLD